MKEHRRGFPGGPVVKNPLCNASPLPLMQQERNSRYSWLLLALRAASSLAKKSSREGSPKAGTV